MERSKFNSSPSTFVKYLFIWNRSLTLTKRCSFMSCNIFPGQSYPDNRGTEFIVGYMANYKLERSPELFVTTSRTSVVTVSVTAPMFPDAGMCSIFSCTHQCPPPPWGAAGLPWTMLKFGV